MEIPSHDFIPKYTPAVYLFLLACIVAFLFFMASSIFISTLPFSEGSWKGVYWGVAFGITALYEGSKLIKAIEFDDLEMVVRYRFRRQKSIDYHEIKGVNLQWEYIDSKRGKVYFYGMENIEELLPRMTGILSNKKILDINLEEEARKTSSERNKRVRYALIFTVAIGLVAEFVGNADWSYFYIILILYFILAYQVLRLFIR